MKKWLAKTLLRYGGTLTVILMLQAGSAALVSLQPRYYQQIVSLVIQGTASTFVDEGLFVVALLAGIYLAGSLLQGVGGYIACLFSANLLKQLQSDFFEKLSRLPLNFFQHQAAGEFFTKFNNDIGQTQQFIADFMPSAMRELITAVVVTVILFYSCPAVLTWTALFIVIVASLLAMLLNRILMRYANSQRLGWGTINKVFDETVQGIDTLKIFATEQQRRERFQKLTDGFRKLSVRAGGIAAVFSPGIDLIAKFGSLLLIFIAYTMIVKGDIRIESFLLFFFYAGLLQTSVSSLVGLVFGLQPQLVAVRKISTFFSESPEDDDFPNVSVSLDISVPIEIHNLRFSYPGGRMLFRNTDLLIPANSITVIHGPSGSGKSTLINLLLQFHAFQKGTIRFGDFDIQAFSRTELRQKISVVTQHHYIFHETLRENLLIAKPDADTAQIIDVLERAHLHDFLMRLPKGIDEILDPQGKNLSGGEKQRICIARLLLKNSPVMILDEPWSNLDDYSRKILADVMNERKSTTTILILTHEDLPSLAVDQVYRLVPGQGIFLRE